MTRRYTLIKSKTLIHFSNYFSPALKAPHPHLTITKLKRWKGCSSNRGPFSVLLSKRAQLLQRLCFFSGKNKWLFYSLYITAGLVLTLMIIFSTQHKYYLKYSNEKILLIINWHKRLFLLKTTHFFQKTLYFFYRMKNVSCNNDFKKII